MKFYLRTILPWEEKAYKLGDTNEMVKHRLRTQSEKQQQDGEFQSRIHTPLPTPTTKPQWITTISQIRHRSTTKTSTDFTVLNKRDLKLRAEIRMAIRVQKTLATRKEREREIERRKKGTEIEGLITCIEIEGLVLINGVGSVADSGEDDE